MPRDLSRSVVAVTGASSGIGRAAAHAFAAQGARVVLLARAPEPLDDVVRECELRGGQALAVPTDMGDEAAVEAAAAAAVERFGSLDVWVNCAGTMVYGRFETIPSDVFRSVVETNFLGYVHGARAALRRFRSQPDGGVLIHVGSIWGKIGSPDVSAYVSSKFAVRGFTECLRQELRTEPHIDVAHIVPQAVDTPIFRAAGNFTGRRVRPVPPMLPPQEIADGIVRCARSPEREVTYRWLARGLDLVHTAAPGLFDRFLPPAFEAGSYTDDEVPANPGTVLEPQHRDRRMVDGWNAHHKAELARAFGATVLGSLRGFRGR